MPLNFFVVFLVFLLAGSVALADCTTAPPGLVSCWKGEGDAMDAASRNNGMLQGGATYDQGIVGSAFSFDGSSGYVLVPDASGLRFTSAMTIELWVKPRSYKPGRQTLLAKLEPGIDQRCYALSLDAEGRANFLVSSDGGDSHLGIVYSSSFVPTNQWTHLAAVYDGASLQVYVNGVLESLLLWAQDISPGNAPLTLGATPAEGSYLEGLLDEVSLYHRALTPAEIQMVYAAGADGKCGGYTLPSILRQPVSQTALVGDTLTLSVEATGTPPLAFEWSFNGTIWPAEYRSAYRTPPLIWNSYALYPWNVSESSVMDQAWMMKTNGYQALGWDMIGIDDSWASDRDGNGNLVADQLRFPNGLASVVTNLHNLGFRVMLYLTMGRTSPEGMPGCENYWAKDVANFVGMGVDAFKIADDSHALDPARIEYSFRQFISGLGTNAENTFVQGSYHTPRLPGPWFSYGLNGHFLVGKHPDGTDTDDNFIMTPDDAGFTNMYSVMDTSILPFAWMIKPGRYLCGYGLAGYGPRYAYQSQMTMCALFCVGATAYSFPMDQSEENQCQTNRVLLEIIKDPAVIPAHLLSRQTGAAEVYARPLAAPGYFAVGMLNRDPSTILPATLSSSDLGFAANTPLTLFEVFSNLTTEVSSGTVALSLDPHQTRLFLVSTNPAAAMLMPPYTNQTESSTVQTSSLILTGIDFAQAGDYSVRVANSLGSAMTTNIVLHVTAIPAMRISLSAQSITLAWPAWATNFVLQTADSPSTLSSSWSLVSAPPVLTNQEERVTVPRSGPAQFFRLRRN